MGDPRLAAVLAALAAALAAGLLAASLAVQLRGQRRIRRALGKLRRDQRRHHRQVLSFHALNGAIAPRAPLYPAGRFAAAPDFLATLVRLVQERRPERVLEAGSGLSTLVLAYALERTGKGRLVSLDHDAAFAERARVDLERHALSGVARVVHAPLSDVEIGDQRWRWYDPASLEGLGDLDLVVIDGPPRFTCPLARYPALPLLASRLRPGGVLILDDGDRDDERACVERWRREHPGLRFEHLDLERGAWLAERRPEPER